MRLSLFCIASAVMVLSECLYAAPEEQGGCNELLTEGDLKTDNEQMQKACNNFYRYVCDSRKGGTVITPKSLKEKLHQKLKALLREEASVTGSTSHAEGRNTDALTSVKSMVKNLYATCKKDTCKKKAAKVKKSVLQMLATLGIANWPLPNDEEKELNEQLLAKTGLRPLANIAAAPDEEKTMYILTLNIPFPRFALPPGYKKQEKEDKYRKYKNFMSNVIELFLGRGKKDQPSSDAGSEQRRAAAENNGIDKQVARVVDDILEVEMKISELIRNSTPHNVLEVKTLEEWEEEFKEKIPFTEALQVDFERAGTTIKSGQLVGILNVKYLKAVGTYLSSLPMKKLTNYLGWYFTRDIADVLTEGVRRKLNEFLPKISKPEIPVDLTEDACIEKLIGYLGVMEKAVAYVYLNTYFNKTSIDKASSVVPRLNSTFATVLKNNSWMDPQTKTKMSGWLSDLVYHIGAPDKLLKETEVEDMYSLVNISEKDSLPLSVFEYRKNDYLQSLRLCTQPYTRQNIWPESSLKTYGRYSEFYTSLETPAAALQEPIFELGAPLSHMYGSVATLISETLAYGLTEEGRVWIEREGKYKWTRKSKKQFVKALECLKEPRYGNKRRPNRQDEDETKVAIKFYDHVALRTSFKAFKNAVEDCYAENPALEVEASKAFFVSYALRHCTDNVNHPDEQSVNYALKTYKEFWTAFKCQEGAPMRANDTCQIMAS